MTQILPLWCTPCNQRFRRFITWHQNMELRIRLNIYIFSAFASIDCLEYFLSWPWISYCFFNLAFLIFLSRDCMKKNNRDWSQWYISQDQTGSCFFFRPLVWGAESIKSMFELDLRFVVSSVRISSELSLNILKLLYKALEKGMATHSSILASENPMDRGAWWVPVHTVAESDTTEAT